MKWLRLGARQVGWLKETVTVIIVFGDSLEMDNTACLEIGILFHLDEEISNYIFKKFRMVGTWKACKTHHAIFTYPGKSPCLLPAHIFSCFGKPWVQKDRSCSKESRWKVRMRWRDWDHHSNLTGRKGQASREDWGRQKVSSLKMCKKLF